MAATAAWIVIPTFLGDGIATEIDVSGNHRGLHGERRRTGVCNQLFFCSLRHQQHPAHGLHRSTVATFTTLPVAPVLDFSDFDVRNFEHRGARRAT